jgi:hypothetical protein
MTRKIVEERIMTRAQVGVGNLKNGNQYHQKSGGSASQVPLQYNCISMPRVQFKGVSFVVCHLSLMYLLLQQMADKQILEAQ